MTLWLAQKWKGEVIWDDIQITGDSSQMEIFKDLSQIEDPHSLVNGDSFRNLPIPCLGDWRISLGFSKKLNCWESDPARYIFITVFLLGGGFKFSFHPYLGKWSNLTNIFQMGWKHHQFYHYIFIYRTTKPWSLKDPPLSEGSEKLNKQGPFGPENQMNILGVIESTPFNFINQVMVVALVSTLKLAVSLPLKINGCWKMNSLFGQKAYFQTLWNC